VQTSHFIKTFLKKAHLASHVKYAGMCAHSVGSFGQVPFRSGHIVWQTFLVLYLLSQTREECKMLVDSNPDFAQFAEQLERNYLLWKRAGTCDACQDLCFNLLPKSGPACMATCKVMLPGMWHLYGPPWMHTCVMHRCISMVVPFVPEEAL
jgi:hypothetical protein